MKQIDISYKPMKELTNSYFIEYSPPTIHTSLAIISITPIIELSNEEIATIMECESEKWCKKYPITTMASSYHKNGDLIDLSDVRESSCLVVFFDKKNNLLMKSWDPKYKNENTYYYTSDVNGYFKDQEIIREFDPDKSRRKFNNQMRMMKVSVFLWLAFIPGIYEILNYCGPHWISTFACFYGLYKATYNGLKIWWVRNPTKAEIEKREIEAKKNHYYYHCEKNPQAFLKLKIENFNKDEEEKFSKSIEL